MPLSKDMSHSEIVKELMQTYEDTNKIGEYTPKNKKDALEIANAIVFKIKDSN